MQLEPRREQGFVLYEFFFGGTGLFVGKRAPQKRKRFANCMNTSNPVISELAHEGELYETNLFAGPSHSSAQTPT